HHRDRAAIGELEVVQQPKLQGLVGDGGDRRDHKTEGAEPAPDIRPRRLTLRRVRHSLLAPTRLPCALLPIRAAPARRAASRRETADRGRRTGISSTTV